MQTALVSMMLVLLAAAPSPSPSPVASAAASPSAKPAVPRPDASDAQAALAYTKDPKNGEVLFDYTFSLIKLQRYPDARRLLGEWKAAAPEDVRHSEVPTLIDRLEKEPDPAKRDQIGADWAREQQRSAEAEMHKITSSMAKVGEGLEQMNRTGAGRTAADVPRLAKEAKERPTAENLLALMEAQVAADDWKGALASAEAAHKADGGNLMAATSVTHLKRYDGKNGNEIRQALQKEKINQILQQDGN